MRFIAPVLGCFGRVFAKGVPQETGERHEVRKDQEQVNIVLLLAEPYVDWDAARESYSG